MSKKWIFLTCVLSLGSIETSQAHPLDSSDIVYIDGLPCNRACQSYMAWSRQTLAASGHQAPAPHRQRPANAMAHRTATEGKQARTARQSVPLPPSRTTPLRSAASGSGKPATESAQQPTRAPTSPSPEQKAGSANAVVAARPESLPLGDVGKSVPMPPDSTTNAASPPAVEPATRTPREQAANPATAPAPDRKADDGDRPDAVKSENTDKIASAPPDAARAEPSASATADPSSGTIAEQMVAALHDAEQATSGSPGNGDQMVALVVARPEINAVSDLAGKDIAMDTKYSDSSDKLRTAIAAAGAAEVHFSAGQAQAVDRLIGGEVPAAILTLLPQDTAFPQFEGFNIFRIPLGPHAPSARL